MRRYPLNIPWTGWFALQHREHAELHLHIWSPAPSHSLRRRGVNWRLPRGPDVAASSDAFSRRRGVREAGCSRCHPSCDLEPLRRAHGVIASVVFVFFRQEKKMRDGHLWSGTLLLAMLMAPPCTVRLQDPCCLIPCCARRFGQVRGRAALTRLTFSSHTSRVTAGLHLGPRAAVARRDRQCRAHGLPNYDPVTNEWVVLAFLELGVGRRRRPQRGDAHPGRPA